MDNSKKNSPCQQGMGFIYLLKNTVTNMCYVGQTVDLARRFCQHRTCKKQLVDKAIQEYGWDNFLHEVLEVCPKDKLNEREIFWIAYYNCVFPNGYNKTRGGNGLRNHQGHPISAETRAKISAAKLGKPFSEEHRTHLSESLIAKGIKPPSREGIPCSEETKAKISVANKGKPAWNKGIPCTEERKAKLSATLKGRPTWNKGIPCPPETRAKISATLTKKNE